jgi:hypothetical protein
MDQKTLVAAIEAITAMSLLTVGLAKPVVDAIKLAFPWLPSGAFPPLATLVSSAMLILLAVSTSTALTGPILAQIVLAGLVSALGAAGINRLHDVADAAQEKARALKGEEVPAPQGAQAPIGSHLSLGATKL